MKLATELCGIDLEHPLMNAAGTCKTFDDVRRFAESTVSAIVLGSITIEPRMGNEGNVYWKHPNGLYSLNSLGLPNLGSEKYREYLPAMRRVADEAGKPLIVNVAGFSPEEYRLLTQLAYESGATLVEVNLGCPNEWRDGQQKPIPSYDAEMIAEILETVAEVCPGGVGFGVKLSPLEPGHLEQVAAALGERKEVQFVTTSNTAPNCTMFEGGKPVISVGYGGMSGKALLPVALGQVKRLYELLPKRIDLIGVGGIRTARDILEYRLAGAKAVQAATVYVNAAENPRAYTDVLSKKTYAFEMG